MPENDDLDFLLDSALATYADPGRDSGLEQRVLAALTATCAEHAAPAKPRPLWLPWAIAIPVAAGLLILWISIGKTVHAPSIQPRMAIHKNAPATEALATNTSEHGQAKHPSGAKARGNVAASAPFASTRGKLKPCADTNPHCGKRSIPKLDVFPTPTPLTDEERALVAAADTGPPSEREALIASQQHGDAPLSIAALNIPPLATSGEGKN